MISVAELSWRDEGQELQYPAHAPLELMQTATKQLLTCARHHSAENSCVRCQSLEGICRAFMDVQYVEDLAPGLRCMLKSTWFQVDNTSLAHCKLLKEEMIVDGRVAAQDASTFSLIPAILRAGYCSTITGLAAVLAWHPHRV